MQKHDCSTSFVTRTKIQDVRLFVFMRPCESNSAEMNRLPSWRPVSCGEPVEAGGTKNHDRVLKTVGGGYETDLLLAAGNEVVEQNEV